MRGPRTTEPGEARTRTISITIDKDVAAAGLKQARLDRRSFSKQVEYLLYRASQKTERELAFAVAGVGGSNDGEGSEE